MLNLQKLAKAYIPMSETAYYILLSLSEPRHGYGIIKFVEQLTEGRIELGSGTVYGTLGKMSKDGLITVLDSKNRRTVYGITNDGKWVLLLEMNRIKKLYQDTLSQEVYFK